MRIARRTFLTGSLAAVLAGCGGKGTTVKRASSTTYRYGDARSQVVDLYRPDGPGPFPVVVLVHGGFWRSAYDRSLMVPLAADLVAAGYAAWNIEYRRVGQKGGGWPGTFADVSAAVDLLATVTDAPLDRDRVVTVGHSAGGHLAMWLAARPGLPDGAPGAGPAVPVRAAVSQAGVVDLRRAALERLGGRAVTDLLGAGPDEVPDLYALASPAERLPLGVAQLLVHGEADKLVPVRQSIGYRDRAVTAGDAVELVQLPGVGHFEVIDPYHASWRAVTDRLPALLA